MNPHHAATGATLTQAARGYRTSLVSHAIRVGCKALGVVVLARLVTPAEHGLFAMAASVFFVPVLLRDLGLGAVVVQAPTLSDEQLSTLWRLHLLLGVVLMLITAAIAPLAASFFGEPRIATLLGAMSLALVLIGSNSWPRVLLARTMQFAELNLLETHAAVAGTAAMMAAAAFGAGAYAFVVFLLASESVALAGAWLACRWRPRAAPRWSSLDGLWGTGAELTGHNLVTATLQQVDAVLMGRWFGAVPLGFYNRSAQLLALPSQHIAGPIVQVLLAALSRLGSSAAGFSDRVRDAANLVAYLTLPLAAVCLTVPEEVVRLVLGAKWPEAAPLLRWLALGAIGLYLGSTASALCIATFNTARLALMSALTLAMMFALLLLGRRHGPEGLAAAVGVTHFIGAPIRLWWATRGTPVRLRHYAAAFLGPLVLATAIAAGLAAGRMVTHDAGWLARLAGSLGVGVASGVFVFLTWPRIRREIQRAIRPTLDDFASANIQPAEPPAAAGPHSP